MHAHMLRGFVVYRSPQEGHRRSHRNCNVVQLHCHPSTLSSKFIVVNEKAILSARMAKIRTILPDFGDRRRRIRLFFGDDVLKQSSSPLFYGFSKSSIVLMSLSHWLTERYRFSICDNRSPEDGRRAEHFPCSLRRESPASGDCDKAVDQETNQVECKW